MLDYFLNSDTINNHHDGRFKIAIEEILQYDIIQEKYKDLIVRWKVDINRVKVMGSSLSFKVNLGGNYIYNNLDLSIYPSQCGLLILNQLWASLYNDTDGIINNPKEEKYVRGVKKLLLDVAIIYSMRLGFSQLRYTATDRQLDIINLLISEGWSISGNMEFINVRTGRSIVTLYRNIIFTNINRLGELIHNE